MSHLVRLRNRMGMNSAYSLFGCHCQLAPWNINQVNLPSSFSPSATTSSIFITSLTLFNNINQQTNLPNPKWLVPTPSVVNSAPSRRAPTLSLASNAPSRRKTPTLFLVSSALSRRVPTQSLASNVASSKSLS